MYMKFILLFGPPAVGKMTVGEELVKLTKLKLFHDQISIDLISHLFSSGTASEKRLVHLFREIILEEAANSDLNGLIFTYVWAFNLKEDWDYVTKICHIFQAKGGEIYFVELEASLETRLKRNKTIHRLACKPSKQNLTSSERNLILTSQRYRLNSKPNEIKQSNYLRINNTNLSAAETAALIKKTFAL